MTNNPASLSDPGGFLFGKVGKFFKRAIRGFGSLARRTVRNYGREIVAAVAAYYTAGAVSGAYMAATPTASLAVGDTLGAVAGGAVAGGVSTRRGAWRAGRCWRWCGVWRDGCSLW